MFGEDRPPATHYRLGGETSGFYAEFLTPLAGGEIDRKQDRKATAEIAGVVSQRLRYIEILLDHPWSVKFASDTFAGTIQLANPVSYLAQKLLIHKRRSREDRAKDIMYTHDTLEVFGARLPELAGLWRQFVFPQINPGAARRTVNAPQTLFGAVSDDIRRAARISAERELSPEDIQAVCRHGLLEVFG